MVVWCVQRCAGISQKTFTVSGQYDDGFDRTCKCPCHTYHGLEEEKLLKLLLWLQQTYAN
jgi:hypothetical protein